MEEKDPVMGVLINDIKSNTLLRCKRSYSGKNLTLVLHKGYRWFTYTYTKGQVMKRCDIKKWKIGCWEIA